MSKRMSETGTVREDVSKPPCLSRRRFLIQSAAGAGCVMTTVLLGDLFGSSVLAADASKPVRFARYPDQRVASLAALDPDRPVPFIDPTDEAQTVCFLVKLGVPAGGGVGAQQDVVAFSSFCTHQGGLLTGSYRAREKVMGPCPMHLSTFNLRRHGILTVGQATSALPQVVLETRGDDLHAIGVIGLMYGYASNVPGGAS